LCNQSKTERVREKAHTKEREQDREKTKGAWTHELIQPCYT